MAGFLGRLFGRPQSRTAAAMAVHAGALVEVVGESHRQDVLRRLAGRTTGSAPFLDDLSGRAARSATRRRTADGSGRADPVHEPSSRNPRGAHVSLSVLVELGA